MVFLFSWLRTWERQRDELVWPECLPDSKASVPRGAGLESLFSRVRRGFPEEWTVSGLSALHKQSLRACSPSAGPSARRSGWGGVAEQRQAWSLPSELTRVCQREGKSIWWNNAHFIPQNIWDESVEWLIIEWVVGTGTWGWKFNFGLGCEGPCGSGVYTLVRSQLHIQEGEGHSLIYILESQLWW